MIFKTHIFTQMYNVTINKKSFDVKEKADAFLVNGKLVRWDLAELDNGHFHILCDTRSYRAEVVTTDFVTKTFTIKINNRLYTASVKDKFDLLLEKMGMSSAAAGKVNTIKAPMPGLIIDLKVKERDAVNAGTSLLILEAMKMENVIKSPGDAIVKSVKIKKGDSVEKGQVLIEFE